MMPYKFTRVTELLIICLVFISCDSKKQPLGKEPLFQLLPSSQTGIDFNNRVEDSKDFNIFNYRNFYNGGGVAIGDVNNDGRPDIFFTSNQHENRLFINKGNWKFEDVTAKAGLGSLHKWHTGVTMVDINGDGWLDIYVCNSGTVPGDDRANELYINQKDGTFKEEAHAYGLDDKGLSTQAVFFDFDHDGDLDCFILNNSPRSVESFGYSNNLRNIRDPFNGDRLYRNDGGKFVDITEKAGIYGSEIGMGLGVTVGDVNNDGWEDIYISNDFFERDYLYINQHDGSFKEVIDDAMGHISQGSMGSDMADINNDGLLDIFTTEMLPESDYRLKTTIRFDDYNVLNSKLKNDYHHQFTSNCLQLNNGDGTFSEIAQLAGVNATGWSWGALSFDFDNDGWKDLFVSNGISKDLTDQDFLEYFGSREVLNQVKQGGFSYKQLLDKMPGVPISNYGFVNQKNLLFKNETDKLGFSTPSFSNGAAYADLDGDGDLDLVVNNENREAFVYRNMTSERLHTHYLKIKLNGISPNTLGFGARVTIFSKGIQQVEEQMPSRGFESSVDPVLNFGLGTDLLVDSLIVRWPNQKLQVIRRIPVDTTIVLEQKNALLNFEPVRKLEKALFQNVTASGITGNIRHKENFFIDFDVERLIPKMLSTEGPKLAIGDVNGDGREDFFFGGASGDTSKLFIQGSNGHFIPKIQPAFVRDKEMEVTAAEFFDADKDGDLDLIVACGGNQEKPGSHALLTRLYLNDGKGNFSLCDKGWPEESLNASCVRAGDFDGDGNPDIFIGARNIPGNYGVMPSSVLLKNNGKGVFTDVTGSLAPGLMKLGMVTDAQWADIDGDGRNELIIVGDWMPITVFKFVNGKFEKQYEIPHSSGWWNCLTVTDIDGDGRLDLIAGNFGLNSKIKADRDHPAKLYVDDFNKNGHTECIPVYYKTDGKAYPYYLKADMVAQIPELKKKFLRFDAYAGKTIEEVFTADQLKHAAVLSVEQTQTSVFINKGNGQFDMQPLPLRAQFSPVFGVLASDLNGDGIKDIFLCGNFFGLKPETGRFDASYGTTFLGDQGHHFNYITPERSGLFIRGEARDVKTLQLPNGDEIILVAVNNDKLYLFRKKEK